ncbi:oligosaccharide flippase family protein [Geminicoccus harenae]|uniref:oligosaccharide flippase family protein n=1 Tax=Geminicoccus harenae TaxID=2498453 RepID=UPI00168B3035|nr:oligosaccharide flippase family protein [Geminicoccus harenae]
MTDPSQLTADPGLARRAARGVAWTMLETWGQQGLQLLFFVLLSRIVGPEGYGILGLALIVNVVGEVLITNGGWGDAVTRLQDPEPELLDSVFWAVMGLALLLVVAAILLAGPAAWFFEIPELFLALPAMSLALPGTALVVVPMALLRRRLQMGPLAMRTLVSLAVAGVAGVLLAWQGAGVWALIVFQVLQSLVGAVLLWPTTGYRPGWRFDRRRLASVTGFVRGATSERVLYMVDALMPRVILGKFLGPIELGYYVLAAKVVELLSLVVQRPIQRILLPAVAHLSQDPQAMGQAVGTTLRLALLVTAPAALGILVTAPDLLPLLFGQSWAEAAHALQFMAVLVMIVPVIQITTSVDYARGVSAPQAWLALLSCVLLAGLVVLLQPVTLVSVAAALMIRGLLIILVRMGRTVRVCRLPVLPLLRDLLPILLAAGVSALAAYVVRSFIPEGTSLPLRVAAEVLAGVAAYAAALMIFARSSLRLLTRLARR